MSVMLLQRLPSCAYVGEDIPHWHRPFRESILIICILRRPTPTTSLNLLGVPRLATPQLFLFPDLTLVPSGRPSLLPLIFYSPSLSFPPLSTLVFASFLLLSSYSLLLALPLFAYLSSSSSSQPDLSY